MIQEITIHETNYYAVFPNLTFKRYSSFNEALEATTLLCVVEQVGYFDNEVKAWNKTFINEGKVYKLFFKKDETTEETYFKNGWKFECVMIRWVTYTEQYQKYSPKPFCRIKITPPNEKGNNKTIWGKGIDAIIKALEIFDSYSKEKDWRAALLTEENMKLKIENNELKLEIMKLKAK